ncbi:MAG: hypothetical protein B7Z39_02605 [Novosphingobium sp. 12-64-8]|nr:MAG: hypothetical protein B7Z39_02605 [Novosphingobium sp. 12-64-8]
MGPSTLDSKIVHKIGRPRKFISASPHWLLKSRSTHASLRCSMAVIAVKRIRFATKRIGNEPFTLLCLMGDRALWVVVAPRGDL